MEKLQLMKTYRNFMNTKFVRNNYDLHAHEWSPAMYVGAAKKVLSFLRSIWCQKVKVSGQVSQKESAFINRYYPFFRQTIVP